MATTKLEPRASNAEIRPCFYCTIHNAALLQWQTQSSDLFQILKHRYLSTTYLLILINQYLLKLCFTWSLKKLKLFTVVRYITKQYTWPIILYLFLFSYLIRVINYRQLNKASALYLSDTSSRRKPSEDLCFAHKLIVFVLTILSFCRAMNRFFIIPNEKII